MALAMMVAAPNSARLVERFGPRRVVSAGLATAAGGLFLLSRLEVDSPYWLIALSLVIIAVGMGSSMAPSTTGIMAAMPLGKAGVGSAVNDTTRELGGALGVAVLGSVLASQYIGGLPDLSGLGGTAEAVARSSLGGALGVAASLAARRRRGAGVGRPRRLYRRHVRRLRRRRRSRGRHRRDGEPALSPVGPGPPGRVPSTRGRPCRTPPEGRLSGGMNGPATTDPPRRRTQRAERAILDATLAMLGEVGFSGLSIDGIAARAGVGKTTIYRHWEGKAHLVIDAFRRAVPPLPEPDTGTLRNDLVEVLGHVAEGLGSSALSRMLPALVEAAERDADLRRLFGEFGGERRAVLRRVLERGRSRGESRPQFDLDLASTCSWAPSSGGAWSPGRRSTAPSPSGWSTPCCPPCGPDAAGAAGMPAAPAARYRASSASVEQGSSAREPRPPIHRGAGRPLHLPVGVLVRGDSRHRQAGHEGTCCFVSCCMPPRSSRCSRCTRRSRSSSCPRPAVAEPALAATVESCSGMSAGLEFDCEPTLTMAATEGTRPLSVFLLTNSM